MEPVQKLHLFSGVIFGLVSVLTFSGLSRVESSNVIAPLAVVMAAVVMA